MNRERKTMSDTNEVFSNFEQYISKLSDEQLGALVREYLLESNHNSWDAWESHHEVVIAELLADIKIYGESINYIDPLKYQQEAIDRMNRNAESDPELEPLTVTETEGETEMSRAVRDRIQHYADGLITQTELHTLIMDHFGKDIQSA